MKIQQIDFDWDEEEKDDDWWNSEPTDEELLEIENDIIEDRLLDSIAYDWIGDFKDLNAEEELDYLRKELRQFKSENEELYKQAQSEGTERFEEEFRLWHIEKRAEYENWKLPSPNECDWIYLEAGETDIKKGHLHKKEQGNGS
jgi:hypothetical protein